MPIRVYRLTSTNTGGGAGAAGVALTTVISKGKIVGVLQSAMIVGGAAAGYLQVELALNNPTLSNAISATGAPSEQLLTRYPIGTVTNGVVTIPATFLPMNVPVVPGNTLCINQNQSGTAPTIHFGFFDVFVQE